MRRLTVFVTLSAVASLTLLACVSDDSSPIVGSTEYEDGSPDAVIPPQGEAGPDATIADGGNDANPSTDAGDGAVAPLVCSDAGTGLCLIVLAASQANPEGAVVHDGFLYWIEEGLPGRIQRIPVAGGPAQQLATGQQDSFALTLDDTSLYWADEYTGTVYSAPLTGVPAGGSPTLLATVDGGSPNTLVVDSSRVYWTDFNAGKIYAAPLGGGTPTVLASGQSVPSDIANDGTNLYWTNDVVNGSVMALSLTDGGAPFAIVPSANLPTRLQVTNGTVYFITNSANVVYAAPTTGITDGGAPTVLVTTGSDTSTDPSVVETVSFAFDGTTVFWATSGNPTGQIRSAIPGGPATTLALGMTSPFGVTFDTTNVYWTNTAFGAVLEMAK